MGEGQEGMVGSGQPWVAQSWQQQWVCSCWSSKRPSVWAVQLCCVVVSVTCVLSLPRFSPRGQGPNITTTLLYFVLHSLNFSDIIILLYCLLSSVNYVFYENKIRDYIIDIPYIYTYNCRYYLSVDDDFDHMVKMIDALNLITFSLREVIRNIETKSRE